MHFRKIARSHGSTDSSYLTHVVFLVHANTKHEYKNITQKKKRIVLLVRNSRGVPCHFVVCFDSMYSIHLYFILFLFISSDSLRPLSLSSRCLTIDLDICCIYCLQIHYYAVSNVLYSSIFIERIGLYCVARIILNNARTIKTESKLRRRWHTDRAHTARWKEFWWRSAWLVLNVSMLWWFLMCQSLKCC